MAESWPLLLLLFAVPRLADACHCSRQGPPPDRNPPNLQCPPPIFVENDPFQINAVVKYSGPTTAYDAEDGRDHPVSRSGLQSGSAFPEGTTSVYFSASDSSGNAAKCSLDITVTVIRCPKPKAIQNGWRHCHPSGDFVKGAVCDFGCYEGYKLSGPGSRITCQSTWHWSDSQPTCQRIECPTLNPPPIGRYLCTDNNFFLSACSLRCPPGFSVPPAVPSVQVCGNNGQWRGSSSICIDSEPPKLAGCGSYFEVVAGKGRAGAEVSWTPPTVSDNNEKNLVATIVAGPRPGTFQRAGTYHVSYTARDSAGNQALPCEITVVVKVLMCPTQYPTPYLRTNCPYGVSYGAICEHSCQGGWKMVGAPKSFCERSSTDPAYAWWDWRGDERPYCQKGRQCPDLPAPVDGAVACDLWYGGEFCQMQCRSGTDFPASQVLLKEINVCDSSGDWSISVPPEPECQAVTPPRGAQVPGAISFFTELCFTEAALQQIRENFIKKLSSSAFRAACNDTRCTVANVEVTCGRSRQKRSTNSTLHDATSAAETSISFRLHTALGTSGEKRTDYQTALTGANAFFLTLESDLDTFLSDVVGENVTIQASALQREFPRPDCHAGSFASYSENACVECSKGSYYDQDKDSCVPCPVGSYQSLSGQTNCTSCASHHSTLESGTSSSQACLPQCSPGQWSATGMQPCSPCARGTLQSRHGATSCLPCPSNMATVEEGASSPEACQGFDLAFPPGHIASTELEFAVTEMAEENPTLSLNFWFQGAVDTEMAFVNFSLGLDDLLLVLTPDANLKLTVNGEDVAGDVSCNASRWRNVHLVLKSSDVTLHVDGQPELQHVTGSQWGHGSMLSNVTKARLVLGGEGFVGAITQLHIWSSDVKPPEVKMTQCSQPLLGNLLSWRQLLDATEKGSYVRLPSQCDAEDACQDSPCQHGTCSDALSGFSCSCQEGFRGPRCDVNTDDCGGHLCVNGGSCVDGVSAYTCTCLANYTGAFCDDVIRHGGWGVWGNWTQCSVTCGEGLWRRQRRCDSPLPQNGGLDCPGEATETAPCNLAVCPECPRVAAPTNGTWTCEDNVTLSRCHVGCDVGFDFDIEPLPEYVCGLETGYEWSFKTSNNPHRRLPNCMPKAAPVYANVTWQADYVSLTCEDAGTREEVTRQATTAMASVTSNVHCVQDNTCKVEKQVVTRCAEDGDRGKRSVQTAGILITISILPSTVGGNQSLAAVTDALGSLNSSARAGAFTVHLGNLVFPLAVNSTYVDALVDCAPGYAFIPHYCVACGSGTRGLGNYCGLCDVGSYQPLQAQTSCLPCPRGWTTPGRGSYSSEECTVAVPSSAASEVKNIVLIIGATVGIILGLALTILIIVVIIKKVTLLRARVDPMIQMNYVVPCNPDVSNVKFKA